MTSTRMPAGMSLAQWAAQMQNAGGGGKNKYLSKWKEKGFANTWLHPQASILSLYRHNFARLYVKEDKQTQVKTTEVYGDNLVCYEDEDTLESMHFRNDDGTRKKPPQVCPFCIMLEHLVQLVRQGKLDWRVPLFEFKGTDSSKNRLFHVGGITGLFNAKKLTDAQLAELAGAASTDPAKAALQQAGNDPWYPASKWRGPIYRKGDNAAFLQDARPKAEYALTVLDNDDVGAGNQIAFVGRSLGLAVIDVIAKSVKEARGPSDPNGERGDPQRHPYVIRWEYNKAAGERNMNDYYDACRMSGIPMTAAVHAALSAPPPDVSKIAERFNLKTLRARLEEHMLVKLPLDAYFKKALALEEREKAAADAAPPPAERVPEVGRNPGSVPLPQPDAGFPSPPAPPPLPPSVAAAFAPGPAVAMFGCDRCKAPMRATDPVCAACGMKYDIEEAPPPPPPPALPSRSSVGKAAVVAVPAQVQAPIATIAVPAPEVDSWGGGDAPQATGASWPGDPSDDIPF